MVLLLAGDFKRQDDEAPLTVIAKVSIKRFACWAQMPEEWALILKGESGDLARFGVHDLTFTHAPGHCRGHVVYHHNPSGCMLAGDFTDVIQREDGSYYIKTMCNKTTCNITQAHETVCR